MAVPKFITNDMKGGYVGGPTTPARRCYVGSGLVYQGFSPASEQEFIQQTAAGGPSEVLKCYGKSIIWRQLVNVASSGNTVNGVTFTPISGNSIKVQGTATANISTLHINNNDAPGIVGHKYLIYGPSIAANNFYLYFTGLGVYAGGGTGIYTCTSRGANSFITIRCNSGAVVDWQGEVLCIDLTDLYGAGNEPTSVAQFLADYPTYDPAYDPGSLQSNKTSLLRAYDGGTLRGSLALNLSTLTGKLNGEGASVVVFPEGMRGVGDSYDELTPKQAIKRRGLVDLGSLTWGKSTAGPYNHPVFFTTDLRTSIPAGTMSLLCAKYTTRENLNPSGLTEGITSYGHVAQGNIIIYDNSLSSLSSADFKAAMSGVMLDYLLATPLTYTLDTPLPTDLTCEQGDILQRVSDNNCPFVGEMKFGL